MKNYETYSTKNAWEPIPFSGEKNKQILEKFSYEPVTFSVDQTITFTRMSKYPLTMEICIREHEKITSYILDKQKIETLSHTLIRFLEEDK